MQGAAGALGLTQSEGQGDGLQRLGRRQAHERAVTPTPPAAPPSSAEQEVLLTRLQRGAPW